MALWKSGTLVLAFYKWLTLELSVKCLKIWKISDHMAYKVLKCIAVTNKIQEGYWLDWGVAKY